MDTNHLIEEFIELLKTATTQDEVEEIISSFSVEGINKPTILYSGQVNVNVNLEEYRYIIHTEAGKVVNDRGFIKLISDRIEKANPAVDKYTARLLTERYINGEEIFKNFVPTGIESNGTTGPWAIVSRNFVAETKGPVVAYIER
ncbi:hypothetical protein SAMN02910370_01481 [Lachnospiraceae bacterium XPB1003]|nr:hypothetical protein SAMN02910370_01481 [Lachnospiraceae bacterium XPB1003]